MSAWNPEANEIFADAAEIKDEKARREFVADRCRDDDALRKQVEALLKVGNPKDDYLSRSIDYQELTMDMATVRVSPGTVIGNYKLLEQIGEGGFGVVYMAEQKEPVRRKVALKIIKAGMDTKEVIARFEAERQALAMMEHPNIAKVLDAGATESGRPYFVMELVRGVSITDFCDENNLTSRERLDLFIPVCQAIQHAHQKAIIHRDIKPSNVLITMHDDVPVPKVIDFGIAKCTQSELTQKTVFTQFRQLLGTPAYMAPEQAQMSGLDIDTRCDVYALGVLLYELLTGTTPFDAKELLQGGFDEICRRLREEEPPSPSTRVSTMDVKKRTMAAKARGSSPERLGLLLRGELDWIIMKAMEKNRTRRYDSAAALASDVTKYLHDEPVSAAAPSGLYKLSKFVRRNKMAVIAVAVVAIALAGGTATTAWQARLATTQRDQANKQRLQAEEQRIRAEQAELLAAQRAQLATQNEQRANKEAERATASEVETRRLLYISDMRAAQLALEDANVDRVRAILERHMPKEGAPDLRGFEWYYFWGLCLPKQRAKKIDIDGRPNTIAFSPTGRSLLVASWNGTAEIRPIDRPTEPSKTYECSSDGVPFASFSKDGRYILVPQNDAGTGESTVLVIEVEQDRTIGRLPQSTPTRNAVFSPDGQRIATLNSGGEVGLWEITGKRLSTLPRSEPQSKRAGLTFSPDGRWLAVACDNDIWIWDNAEDQLVKKLPVGYFVKALTFTDSTEGKLLAGAGAYLFTFDTRDWMEVDRFKKHEDEIRCIALSPDGSLIATASRDNTINLWDRATRRVLTVLKGHSGIVDGVSFSPDGKTLASVSQDYSIAFWDVAEALSGQPIVRSDDKKHFIKVGQRLFNVNVDAGARGLDVITIKDEEFGRLVKSSQGLLAVVKSDSIEFRQQNNSHRIARPNPGAYVGESVFSPDGNYFAWSTSGGMLNWCKVDDRKELAKIISVRTGVVQPLSLAIDPTNSYVAMGFRDGTIAVWNRDSGAEYRDRWKAHKEWAKALCFHPSTVGLLFSGSMDLTIKAWHLDERKPRLVLKDHTAMVNALLFSSDGKTLFSAGGETTIRVWDTKYWEVRCVLPTPFSAQELEMLDERTLLAGNLDVQVWRGASDEDVGPQ